VAKKKKLRILSHRLEAKDTRIIGFLAKKHTTETHIGRFGDYLQGLLPRAVPEFVIEHLTASIRNGLKAKMTTEVIAIRTATEDAEAVDKRFKQRFPANTNDGEYYVSYMSNIDDATMRGIYKKQNTWLHQVELIPIGGFTNIDKKVDIGFTKPVSLREFMRSQPTSADKDRVPIDIENGGRSGKAKLIVHKKYKKQAVKTYEEWERVTQSPPSEDEMDLENESVSSKQREENAAYVHMMKELALEETDGETLGDEEDFLAPPKFSNQRRAHKKKKLTKSYAETLQGGSGSVAPSRQNGSPKLPETMDDANVKTAARNPRQAEALDEDFSSVSSVSMTSSVESEYGLDSGDDTGLSDLDDNITGEALIRDLYKKLTRSEKQLRTNEKLLRMSEKRIRVAENRAKRSERAAAMDRKRLDAIYDAVASMSKGSDETDIESLAESVKQAQESVKAAMSWVYGEATPTPPKPTAITIERTPTQTKYDTESPPAEAKKQSKWVSPPRKHTAASSVTPKSPVKPALKTTNNRYGPLDDNPTTVHGKIRSDRDFPNKGSSNGESPVKKKKKHSLSPSFEDKMNARLRQQEQIAREAQDGSRVDGAFAQQGNTFLTRSIKAMTSFMATDEDEMNCNGGLYEDDSDNSL